MPSHAPGPEDRGHDTAAAGSALLADFSLDMTGKPGELEQARAVLPPGTRVHVGFTGGQDLAGRAGTARAVERSGFVPVPVIAARRLRSEAMLREYLDSLRAADASGSGLAGGVVTQFGFGPALVLAWLADARARSVGLPARVGVPGPASVRLLLSYASRCGVSVSAPAARGYGFSLSGPAVTAAPGRFIRALASGYDPRVHGEVKLHVNPFGGFTATAEWASWFRNSRSREVPANNTERGSGCSMS